MSYAASSPTLERRVCYHITHRCHDREFRFRFVKYRETYRWSSAAAIGDPDWLAHTAGQIGMERFDTIEGAAEDGLGVKTFFLSTRDMFKGG